MTDHLNQQSPVPRYQFPRTISQAMPQTGSYPDLAVILFFLAHIPLALLADINRALATGYALAVLGLGLLWALSKRTPQRFAYLAAYIAGAEAVWRMTNAQVFWEFGKYATALVMAVGIFAIPRERSKFILLPIVYFLLLIPSTVLTFSSLSLNQARQAVSFNLSGPFALMLCVVFFYGTKFDRTALANLVIAFCAPVTGMAGIIFDTIRRLGFSVIFTDASNFTTSGGFGPNQVSATLGLAALFLFIFLLYTKKHALLKVFFFLLLTVFATESILTFSRGGVYIAGASGILIALLSTIGRKSLIRAALVSLAVLIVAYFWIFPFINSFTDGTVLMRYRESSLTGRETLVRTDLEIFRANPWIGIGPGMALYHRSGRLEMVAAHTEFSRLLAEHGVLGLLSIFCFFLMGFLRFIRSSGLATRALVAGFFLWAVLFMLVNSMRLVAPSFIIGVTAITFIDDLVVADTAHRSYYGFGEWKKAS